MGGEFESDSRALVFCLSTAQRAVGIQVSRIEPHTKPLEALLERRHLGGDAIELGSDVREVRLGAGEARLVIALCVLELLDGCLLYTSPSPRDS